MMKRKLGQSQAYIIEKGQEELFLEAVDAIEPKENFGYRLVNIFGEQKICEGRLKVMNLVNHKIVFEK
jgi:predicted RNA-binding protein